MRNETPPALTDEEIRANRESRRTWFGPLADDNIEHVVTRMRRLLTGQYYTFVANVADYAFAVPDVRASQFLTPGKTTDGTPHDGIRMHRIGDEMTHIGLEDDGKVWDSCGLSIIDNYGVGGFHSSFATERAAYDALHSGDLSKSRWVTQFVIEGGNSDDPREVGSRDRIEATFYNYMSPPQQIQWVITPERHWDESGPDQYKEKQITQEDVSNAFHRGSANALGMLEEAANRRVKPHKYVSGVGHMTAPEDVIDCCPFGPGHAIHEVKVFG